MFRSRAQSFNETVVSNFSDTKWRKTVFCVFCNKWNESCAWQVFYFAYSDANSAICYLHSFVISARCKKTSNKSSCKIVTTSVWCCTFSNLTIFFLKKISIYIYLLSSVWGGNSSEKFCDFKELLKCISKTPANWIIFWYTENWLMS